MLLLLLLLLVCSVLRICYPLIPSCYIALGLVGVASSQPGVAWPFLGVTESDPFSNAQDSVIAYNWTNPTGESESLTSSRSSELQYLCCTCTTSCSSCYFWCFDKFLNVLKPWGAYATNITHLKKMYHTYIFFEYLY
jgi:hypothetical protein